MFAVTIDGKAGCGKSTLADELSKILELKKESPDKDTSIEETMINNLIYDIYGLSKDEIKIIEESV